jgi:hypothetical protein
MSGSQVYNGMTFRDEKELTRYKELEKLSKQGLISDLYRNVKFEICPERYGNKRSFYFIADFTYKEGEKRIAEDAKSGEHRKERAYELEKSLFLVNYPEFIFREV